MCQGELKNDVYLQIGTRSMVHTVWKIQILRETKVGDLYEILHFLKAEIYQIIRPPKIAKKGNYRTSRFPKIDFT